MAELVSIASYVQPCFTYSLPDPRTEYCTQTQESFPSYLHTYTPFINASSSSNFIGTYLITILGGCTARTYLVMRKHETVKKDKKLAKKHKYRN